MSRSPRRRRVAAAVCSLVAAAALLTVAAQRVTGGDATAWWPGKTGNGSCPPGVTQNLWVPEGSGGSRRVVVRRPAGPDSAAIPVLYLLHGYPGNPVDLMKEFGAQFDAAICRTGRPFVVAAPDGESDGLDTEWGDDAAGRFAVESFVTGETVAAVEGNAPRGRALRAIAGVSMGGFGAATLALRHSPLYSQVVAFGGYYRLDDPDGVFDGDDTDHAPDRLVGPQTAAELRFFLVEGTREHTALQDGSIRGEADRFAGILSGNGVAVAVRHPDGGHDARGWVPAIPDSVAFLEAGWA